MQRVAGVSGALGVGAAAYGAHGLKCDPEYKRSFDNANKMHFIHTGVLVAAPLFPHPLITGGLFAMGTLAFSGACYTVALKNDAQFSKAAPFGGFLLIAGWLSLII